MTPEQFWNDPRPETYWAYRQRYINAKKLEENEKLQSINFEQWLGGLYVFNAIAAGLSMGKQSYIEKPIDILEPIKQKTMTPEERQKEMELISRAEKMRVMALLDKNKKRQQ